MSAPVMLVTGAGSGIGAATAVAAARDGWHVVLVGRRREALDAVAARCGGGPGTAVGTGVATGAGTSVRPADVTDGEAVDALVEDIVAEFGRLDCVVANAGVMAVGSVVETAPSDWDRVLTTNLTSVYRLLRAAVPHLVAARGSVVGISSIAGLRSPGGSAAYAVSKAALVSLVQTVARDFGPEGLRANVICPGWVRTEMADAEMDEFGAAAGLDREAAYETVTALVPQGRPGLPEEIASAVLWLAGPGAGYVNGACLVVDGGTVLVDPGTVAFDVELTPRG